MTKPKYSYNGDGVYAGVGDAKMSNKQLADVLNTQLDILHEIATSGVANDFFGGRYIEAQIDKDTWSKLQEEYR